jgi:hemerythrin-like metal-binding protein
MPSHDPIVWSDALVTGVAEIDDQHRILVNTLNAAGAKLSGNPDAALLDQITRDLLSYALYHFETEEALMEQFIDEAEHRADIQAHGEQHRGFSSKVVAVREGIKAGSLISRDDLLAFLNGWLVHHIMNTDKKLATLIIARRQASAAQSAST